MMHVVKPQHFPNITTYCHMFTNLGFWGHIIYASSCISIYFSISLMQPYFSCCMEETVQTIALSFPYSRRQNAENISFVVWITQYFPRSSFSTIVLDTTQTNEMYLTYFDMTPGFNTNPLTWTHDYFQEKTEFLVL